MAILNISLDLRTGTRTATAPGFNARLARSQVNPDWFTIQISEASPEVREMLRGQFGTLDTLKQTIEAALWAPPTTAAAPVQNPAA